MIEFPEVIEATMQQEDLAAATEAMKVPGRWALTCDCPVAQVLSRVFPGVRWVVGVDTAAAYSHSVIDRFPHEEDALARYSVDPMTKVFIYQNGWGKDTWLEAEPLAKMRFTRKARGY
jgi:hypothetical protein